MVAEFPKLKRCNETVKKPGFILHLDDDLNWHSLTYLQIKSLGFQIKELLNQDTDVATREAEMNSIIDSVCDFTGFPRSSIMAKRGGHELELIRHVLIHILFANFQPISYSELGRFLNYRCHGTIGNSLNLFRQLQVDYSFTSVSKRIIDEIRRRDLI